MRKPTKAVFDYIKIIKHGYYRNQKYPVNSYKKLFCLTLNRLYATCRKYFDTVVFSMMLAFIKDSISFLFLRECLVSKEVMHYLKQRLMLNCREMGKQLSREEKTENLSIP